MARSVLDTLRSFQFVLFRWQSADGVEQSCRGWIWLVDGRQVSVLLREDRPPAGALRPESSVELDVATPAGLAHLPGCLHAYQAEPGRVEIRLTGTVTMTERRRFPRAKLNLAPVMATQPDAITAGRRYVPIYLCNLSASGAKLISLEPLAPFDRLDFDLPLDDGTTVSLTLTVLASWEEASPEPRHLVRGTFAEIDPESQQRVEDYVTRRLVSQSLHDQPSITHLVRASPLVAAPVCDRVN